MAATLPAPRWPAGRYGCWPAVLSPIFPQVAQRSRVHSHLPGGDRSDPRGQQFVGGSHSILRNTFDVLWHQIFPVTVPARPGPPLRPGDVPSCGEEPTVRSPPASATRELPVGHGSSRTSRAVPVEGDMGTSRSDWKLLLSSRLPFAAGEGRRRSRCQRVTATRGKQRKKAAGGKPPSVQARSNTQLRFTGTRATT